MDALSVVSQLKRVASDKSASEEVKSKIPRVAVGLSYFIEHPDGAVQHEAAKTLLIVCKIHKNIILNCNEIKELRTNIMPHLSSNDCFLKDICTKILYILNNVEKINNNDNNAIFISNNNNNKNNVKCYENNGSFNHFISQNDACKKNSITVEGEKKVQEEREEGNMSNKDITKNTKNDYAESTDCRSSTSNSSPRMSSPQHMHISNLSESSAESINYKNSNKNTCNDHVYNAHSYNNNTSHFSSSSSLLSFSSLEGSELYTLILGLKRLAEEDEHEWKSAENFRENLQQKVICLPGVISSTVSIKKKKTNENESSNKNRMHKNNKIENEYSIPQENKNLEEDLCEDLKEEIVKKPEKNIRSNFGRIEEKEKINNIHNTVKKNEPQLESTDEEKKDAEKTSKVEIIATVVIRLPFDKIQRKEVLDEIKRSYFILNVERMKGKSDTFRESLTLNTKGRREMEGGEDENNEEYKRNRKEGREVDEMKDNFSCNEETRKEKKEEKEEEESDSCLFRSDYDETDIEEDELTSGALDISIRSNSGILHYLDEEEDEDTYEYFAREKKEREKEGNKNAWKKTKNWEHSTSGWSFFNKNSALFGESRYLSRTAIIPSEEDKHLIEKLRKEKERKAAEQEAARRLKKQNALDRVLQGISTIKFW